jgi:SAM-dependent methyltransferase
MGEQELYRKYAKYYDLIYSWKNYSQEVEFIKKVIKRHKKSEGNDLLELACGTGNHTQKLVDNFKITGVDINPEMIKIAREKLPRTEFLEQDMKNLELERQFDVITCLFSAINYHENMLSLENTLKMLYKHLKQYGVLIFDLGICLDNWEEGRVSVDTAVNDDLQLARISQSRLINGIFNANFIFLINKNGNVDFEIDEHRLGVFSTVKVKKILTDIGFDCWVYDGFYDLYWDENSGEGPVFVCFKN